MPTLYKFPKALERLESRINIYTDEKYLPQIPSFEECGFQGSYLVYGTVVSIQFDYSSDNVGETTIKEIKALECFTSAICEVFRSNSSCRDVIVTNKSVLAVYSTPFKSEINEVIDDLARVLSLASVVEKKLGLRRKTIKVQEAACYDKLSMSVLESRNYCKQFLWRGKAISDAIKMSQDANYYSIWINKKIWNNLTDNYQKMFKFISLLDESYEGKIVNVAMNNWLDSKQ